MEGKGQCDTPLYTFLPRCALSTYLDPCRPRVEIISLSQLPMSTALSAWRLLRHETIAAHSAQQGSALSFASHTPTF